MIVSGTPNFRLTFWRFSKNGADCFRSLGQSRVNSPCASNHARLPRALESSSARIFIAVLKNPYYPLTLRFYFKENPAGMPGNQMGKAIGPFDHANAIAKKIIIKAKPVGRFAVSQSEEIEMIDGQSAALIFVHDRKCRTGCRGAASQCRDKTLCKGRFAAA